MSRFEELEEEGRGKDPKTVNQEILSLSRDPRFSSLLEALRWSREGWVKYASDPKALKEGTQSHYVGGVAAVDHFLARLQTVVDEKRVGRPAEEPPEPA